jgi:hypothetical protein
VRLRRFEFRAALRDALCVLRGDPCDPRAALGAATARDGLGLAPAAAAAFAWAARWAGVRGDTAAEAMARASLARLAAAGHAPLSAMATAGGAEADPGLGGAGGGSSGGGASSSDDSGSSSSGSNGSGSSFQSGVTSQSSG